MLSPPTAYQPTWIPECFFLMAAPVYKKQQHMNSSLEVISVRAYRHVSFLGAVRCLLLLLSGLLLNTSVQQIQQTGALLVKHLLKTDLEALSSSLTSTVYNLSLRSSECITCSTLNVYVGKLWRFYYPDIFFLMISRLT